MKLSTLAIAFGPAVLALTVKFALDPAWLKEWSLLACLSLGAGVGYFAGMAANIVEPDH